MKNMTVFAEQAIAITTMYEVDPVGSPLQIGAYQGVKVAVVVPLVLPLSTLTPVIEVYSPATGEWEAALSGAAFSAAGNVTLTVHPDLTPTLGSFTEASAAIADRFRITMRATGAGGRATAGLTMLV